MALLWDITQKVRLSLWFFFLHPLSAPMLDGPMSEATDRKEIEWRSRKETLPNPFPHNRFPSLFLQSVSKLSKFHVLYWIRVERFAIRLDEILYYMRVSGKAMEILKFIQRTDPHRRICKWIKLPFSCTLQIPSCETVFLMSICIPNINEELSATCYQGNYSEASILLLGCLQSPVPDFHRFPGGCTFSCSHLSLIKSISIKSKFIFYVSSTKLTPCEKVLMDISISCPVHDFFSSLKKSLIPLCWFF